MRAETKEVTVDRVKIGALQTLSGNLYAEAVIDDDDSPWVKFHLFEPSDTMKQGVVLTLDEEKIEQLKEIIAIAQTTLTVLRTRGKAGSSAVLQTLMDRETETVGDSQVADPCN